MATPHNLPDIREFAIDLYQILEYHGVPSPFRRRFNYFINVSLGRAIVGAEAEEILREHKEAQQRAKRQSGNKRIVARGGVLKKRKLLSALDAGIWKKFNMPTGSPVLN